MIVHSCVYPALLKSMDQTKLQHKGLGVPAQQMAVCYETELLFEMHCLSVRLCLQLLMLCVCLKCDKVRASELSCLL